MEGSEQAAQLVVTKCCKVFGMKKLSDDKIKKIIEENEENK